jgi:uncharacterized pyridoxal phosphate-containing UPF0001 family protein
MAGFMGMAAEGAPAEIIRTQFAGLRRLRDEFQKHLHAGALKLSMGMSQDYKLALREGSDIIRIGSLLFSN